MRPDDLITTCLHNLLRHKSRTVLTILGVVVGCCSVVLMISFGIAMNIATKASLAEMGDLSIISVSTNGKTKITNKNVEKMKQIDGALAVTPQLSPSFINWCRFKLYQ
jgi:ABC-type antimicrobial peptide transport system permease subunit